MRRVSTFFKIAIVFCCLSWPTLTIAQDSSLDPPPIDDDCDAGVADVPCPFDGGVSLLVASGIAFGLKKARDQRNNNKVIK